MAKYKIERIAKTTPVTAEAEKFINSLERIWGGRHEVFTSVQFVTTVWNGANPKDPPFFLYEAYITYETEP